MAIIGDFSVATDTAAVMDRIVHSAHCIELKGASMRKVLAERKGGTDG